jgi:ankyrin repeat protein
MSEPTNLQDELLKAVQQNKNAEIKRLVTNGADVNHMYPMPRKVNENFTLVHVTAGMLKSVSLTNTLLECKADVKLNSTAGNVTPLHAAASVGCLGTVDALLRNANPDVNARSASGATPSLLAAAKGFHDCLNALLYFGNADATIACNQQTTALHHACRAKTGSEQCVRMLLSRGASVNAVDARGCTPAHLAANNSNVACLQLLVDAGADLNLRDSLNKTPLESLPPGTTFPLPS